MTRQSVRIGTLLLCLLSLNWAGVTLAAGFEGKGEIVRYDSAQKILYIESRKYQMTEDVSNILSAHASYRGDALQGLSLTFHADWDEKGRLLIDEVGLTMPE